MREVQHPIIGLEHVKLEVAPVVISASHTSSNGRRAGGVLRAWVNSAMADLPHLRAKSCSMQFVNSTLQQRLRALFRA